GDLGADAKGLRFGAPPRHECLDERRAEPLALHLEFDANEVDDRDLARERHGEEARRLPVERSDEHFLAARSGDAILRPAPLDAVRRLRTDPPVLMEAGVTEAARGDVAHGDPVLRRGDPNLGWL